jgi:hypothetical protein
LQLGAGQLQSLAVDRDGGQRGENRRGQPGDGEHGAGRHGAAQHAGQAQPQHHQRGEEAQCGGGGVDGGGQVAAAQRHRGPVEQQPGQASNGAVLGGGGFDRGHAFEHLHQVALGLGLGGQVQRHAFADRAGGGPEQSDHRRGDREHGERDGEVDEEQQAEVGQHQHGIEQRAEGLSRHEFA